MNCLEAIATVPTVNKAWRKNPYLQTHMLHIGPLRHTIPHSTLHGTTFAITVEITTSNTPQLQLQLQ